VDLATNAGTLRPCTRCRSPTRRDDHARATGTRNQRDRRSGCYNIGANFRCNILRNAGTYTGTALIVQHTRCRCKCFGLSGVPNGRLRFVLARPEGRHAPTGGVEWRRRRLGSLPSRSLARRRRHSSPKDRLCQRAALEADLAANEAAVRRLIAAIATGSFLGWTKDLPDESFRYRNPRPALDIDDLDHFASRVSEIRFTTRRESARRDYFVIQYSKLSTSA
jgi:hypothetical protein